MRVFCRFLLLGGAHSPRLASSSTAAALARPQALNFYLRAGKRASRRWRLTIVACSTTEDARALECDGGAPTFCKRGRRRRRAFCSPFFSSSALCGDEAFVFVVTRSEEEEKIPIGLVRHVLTRSSLEGKKNGARARAARDAARL